MKKSYWIIFFLGISVIVYQSLNNSYAYEPKVIQYKLFYSSDMQELNNNINKYIDDIDNIIMPSTTYEDSPILTENYSFLTNFAIKYILQYRELYKDDIIIGDNYSYYNLNREEKITNQYVKEDTIYTVTDWFFGIDNYYIDSNRKLNNELIPLTDETIYEFNQAIKNIESYKDGELIKSIITYDDDSKFLYTFCIKNNVLKIKNIEVEL